MIKKIGVGLLCIYLVACSADQEFIERKISDLENRMSLVEQPRLRDSLQQLYEEYQDRFPSSDSAGTYCYRNIILYQQQRKHNKAVRLVEQGMSSYKGEAIYPKLLIIGGELYDRQFDEQEKAKALYNEYIKFFPNGEDIDKAYFYFKPKDEQSRIIIEQLKAKVDDERQRDGVNHFVANQLINSYAAYAKTFDDEYTANYCKEGAFLAITLKETLCAVEFFTKIYEDYPEYPFFPEMLFHLATQYENSMPSYARKSPTKQHSTQLFDDRRTKRMLTTNHLEKARYLYNELIENYPYHEASESARMLLANLGKTPNEFIELFLEKQARQDSLLALDTTDINQNE